MCTTTTHFTTFAAEAAEEETPFSTLQSKMCTSTTHFTSFVAAAEEETLFSTTVYLCTTHLTTEYYPLTPRPAHGCLFLHFNHRLHDSTSTFFHTYLFFPRTFSHRSGRF